MLDRRLDVLGVGDGFGDAEVRDDRCASAHEDVVRLDVAVDDASVVREGERLGDVAEQPDHFGDRQRAALAQV